MAITDPRAVIDAFNQAWGDHDLDSVLALLTADAVFESTGPAPDGGRCVGPVAIRAAWAPIFADPASRFEVEELLIVGSDAVQRWRYSWDGGHVRGIDLMTVVGDRISRKLSYVKG